MAIKFFTTHTAQKGFTLVEMIMVLAIVGVMSAITMFNYGDFRQSIDTRNLAQEMALSIRKAQSYATSSKKLVSGDSGYPDGIIRSFGIVFSTATMQPEIGFPYSKAFTLYAALPVDGMPTGPKYFFDSGNVCGGNSFAGISLSTECLEYFTITSPVSVTKLEIFTSGGWSAIPQNEDLSIIFHRPTPDAEICFRAGTTCTPGVSAGRITVTSQNGKIQKRITVWNTGQIAVENVVQAAAGLNCYPGDQRIECASDTNLNDTACNKKGGC